ncbi:hypothetical protein HBI84_027080 [Parastagonospora nodorum]|nr:hypothetical protein HBI84_027080 [Parastagonospora nodorum]
MQQELHAQKNSATKPSMMLENFFFSPEVPAYVTFDKLVEAAANSPRLSRRTMTAPRPVPASVRPSAPPEDENHCRSDLPWHHASSNRLVLAAANSPRIAPKQIQVPAVLECQDEDCSATSMQRPRLVSQPPFRAGAHSLRPARRVTLAPRPSSPPLTEDEEAAYTSRPQIRRPPTQHQFSAFLGEDHKNNHEGGVQALRPSRFQRLKAKLKKTLRRAKDFAIFKSVPSLRPTYWSDKIPVAAVTAVCIVLCVGIVIAYNDTSLLKILSGFSGDAAAVAASPYVIAMKDIGITGLPHLTNAPPCTSIFSASNAYTYYGTRSRHALSLDGHASKALRKCTKSGIPIYCLIGTCIFLFLGFLNVSSSSAKVLTWFTSIVTAAQIIDHIPYSTWVALIFLTCVVTCYGYPVFLQGHWAIDTFFTFYLLVLLAPFLFFGWKLLKRTKSVNPLEADLVWQKPVIDAYEEAFDEPLSDFGKRLAICCNRYNRWVELENRHKIIRT